MVLWASLLAQLAKNLPAMRETWVRSLGWEDPLEKGKATHSRILPWRIPQTVQSKELDTTEQLSVSRDVEWIKGLKVLSDDANSFPENMFLVKSDYLP